ncbi:MAG: 50S ribosomal protein L6 [Chlamydiia bacterium]|nr:50S ribosomal protein L6 [Chlamydiia bacterium]MCH9618494.1 50S ribosomal protein L6 [Chlamydiia bacterium]MCH9623783.1 50S ribosomal protein L6 [Chlamydiia bacterium]
MSRLAKKPVELPKGVEVTLAGDLVTVKGPKGSISITLSKGVKVELTKETLAVVGTDELTHHPFLGLDISRLKNALEGVSTGFKKTLELVGVGYKAAVKGSDLDLSLGFSHPCILAIPKSLKVEVEKNTRIHVSGVDKVEVGQFSATIRSKRPPEPYKGKGVKYEGEYIKRKAGKKAK